MRLLVVGGGPGGTEAALRAARGGHEVTVVERDRFGGTCTNRGCIPTKFLIAAAERALAEGASPPGQPAWAKIQARKRALTQGLSRQIEQDLRAAGVTTVKGSARLVSPREVSVTTGEGAGGPLAADALVVATGSEPARPPLFNVDGGRVLTSDEALELDRVPASVVVVGSGFIGTEFAHLFALLGAKVTLLEALPHLLPGEDDDTAAVIRQAFSRRGIDVVEGRPVARVEASGEGVEVSLDDGRRFGAELALVSVGRRRATAGIGLEAAGLEADRQGALAVDSRLRTGVPGVWAVGDVTPLPMLAHVASAQGAVAADSLAGEGREADYRALPWAVFIRPEIGTVGLTEAEAARREVAVKVGKAPLAVNIKARIDADQAGFVKLLADAASGVLVGATVVGPRAADMVHTAGEAIAAGVTVGVFARRILVHPTLSESFRDAAEDLLRKG